MTINTTDRKDGPYIGDDVQTEFPFGFKVFKPSDLMVVRLDSSAGVETILSLNSDYTVALNSNQNVSPGGGITLVAPLESGRTLTITSSLPYLQPADLTNQGGFYPDVINNALDRLTIFVQQIVERLGRTLSGPVSDAQPLAELPPAAERANYYLVFDAQGNPSLSTGTGADAGLRADLADSSLSNLGAGMVGYRGRTVRARLDDELNVKDYGAKGDGVTNDYAAISSVIASSFGRKVKIPSGSYRLRFSSTSALIPPANCIIEGDGPVLTLLQFEPDSDTFRNLFTLTNAFTLRNLSVRVVAHPGQELVMFNINSGGVEFDNCNLDGTMTNVGPALSHAAHCFGLAETGTQIGITIKNCAVHHFSYGLLKTNTATSVQRQIRVASCDFYLNYREDLSFNTPNGTIDGLQVVGCKFSGGLGATASLSQLYCALASVSNFVVSDNTFTGTAEAIHLEEACYGGTVTGNNIDIDGVGIFVTDNNVGGVARMPDNISISGNSIRKLGTPVSAGSYGIYLVNDASAEVPAINVAITGNVITDFQRGISTGATLDDGCKIDGNLIDGCTYGLWSALAAAGFSGNTTRRCPTGVYTEGGGTFDRHCFIDCTLAADSVSRPVVLNSPAFLFAEFSVGASSTTYRNLVALGSGDRAHAFMSSLVMSSTIADRGARRDEITWDGTTFTRTNKITETPGAISTDIVRNSAQLAVQVFSTSARTNVTVQVAVDGALVVGP